MNKTGSNYIEPSNKNKRGSIIIDNKTIIDKIGNVDKQNSILRKYAISFLCLSILFNNIFIPLTQAKIVPSGEKDYGNGREKRQIVEEDEENNLSVINIAAPNENGISHNSFKSFSILTDDKKKVLINNNSKTLKNTFSSDPTIKSNPNIGWTGGIASTIVFEVDGEEDINLNDSIIEVLGGKNVSMIFASPRGITTRGATIKGTANKLDLIAGAMNDKNKLEFDIGENGNMVFSHGSSSNLSLFAPAVKEIRLLGRTIQLTGEVSSKEKITIDSKVDIDLRKGAKLKTDTLDILAGDLRALDASSIEVRDLRIKSGKNILFDNGSTIDVLNDMETAVEGWFSINGGSSVSIGSNMDVKTQKEFKVDGKSTLNVKNNLTTSSGVTNFIDGSGVHVGGTLDIQGGDVRAVGASHLEANLIKIKSKDNIQIDGSSTIDTKSDLWAYSGGWFHIGNGSHLNIGNDFISRGKGTNGKGTFEINGNSYLRIGRNLDTMTEEDFKIDSESTVEVGGQVKIKAKDFTNGNKSMLHVNGGLAIDVGNKLLNDNKSTILTETGDLILKGDEVKNHGASTVQSGRKLIVNGRIVENVGHDDQNPGARTEYTCLGGHDEGLRDTIYCDGDWAKRRWVGDYKCEKSDAFVEHYEMGEPKQTSCGGGKGKSVVEVLFTMSPSQMVANGDIVINGAKSVDNRGSIIMSGSDVVIKSDYLTNERPGFGVNLRFGTYREWRTKGWYHWCYQCEWTDTDHYMEYGHFYANTPSVIYGKNININAKNLDNDRLKEHDSRFGAEHVIPGFIYAEDKLRLKGALVRDGGLAKGKNGTIIETSNYETVGNRYLSDDSPEFKGSIESMQEYLMTNRLMVDEEFRRELSSASNLKADELTSILEGLVGKIVNDGLEKGDSKRKTKIRVVLYHRDDTVRGYSYDPDPKTKVVGLNIKNINLADSADLIDTIFHECYDEKKHSKDEKSALRFGGYAAEVWNRILDINRANRLKNQKIANLNREDSLIVRGGVETDEIYARAKKGKGVLNERVEIWVRNLDGPYGIELLLSLFFFCCLPFPVHR
ncbi:hypothetical protein FACS1894152_5880 [Bacilli bacterium]|nr:hypothetical protein FACS1894152_5880 [Bacilli bacterium]